MERSTEQPRVVVVGAGIAGLAAAWQLHRQLPTARVTVLEATPRVGGKLRLGEVAGRTVDLGAEALLHRRPEAVELARAVGLGDQIVHPLTTSAGIWTRGLVRPLPPTLLGVPADLDALRTSGIVDLVGARRAALERWLPWLYLSEDISVGSLVGRRLGHQVRDRLVEPLLGGVYAGRAEELSTKATLTPLVPAIEEHGGLLSAAAALLGGSGGDRGGGRPRPVFAGLRGGVGRLAEGVEAALRAAGVVVRCGETVRELRRTESGFRLVTGPTLAPEVLDAEAVVLATPATPSARLLASVAPAAAVELAGIDYASMALVTLAIVDRGTVLSGSGFLVPPGEGRRIKAATFSSEKWGRPPGGPVIVRCSFGRIGEESELQVDDAELIGRARLDLRAAVRLGGTLVDAEVTRWGGALPQYRVGHLDRVARIRSAVAEVSGLAVCGAAYDGIGVPACIASATAAATRVATTLSHRDTMPA